MNKKISNSLKVCLLYSPIHNTNQEVQFYELFCRYRTKIVFDVSCDLYIQFYCSCPGALMEQKKCQYLSDNTLIECIKKETERFANVKE